LARTQAQIADLDSNRGKESLSAEAWTGRNLVRHRLRGHRSIAGEPGVGKSRLAQKAAFNARAQGLRVLWGAILAIRAGFDTYELPIGCRRGARIIPGLLGTNAAEIAHRLKFESLPESPPRRTRVIVPPLSQRVSTAPV
jgi:hypothetical protein